MSHITRILEHGSANTRPSIRWRGPIALSLGALITAVCIGNAASNANAAEAAPYTAVQEDARQERTTGPVNTTCPITGREVTADSPTVDVRDYTVAFCCNNCVAKFNENPREYLTSMRAAGVFGQQSRGDERPDRRRQGADGVNLKIGRMLIDLGTAVENGEISAEDAMKRIVGLAQRMGIGKEEKAKTITREDYANAQREMQAMVDKGDITEEQMNQRLAGMRKMIGKSRGGDGDKAEYMERIGERLKMAVESGAMTRAEAGEKYAEMEKEYDARSSAKADAPQKRLTRRDYADAQAKMQEMVDTGDITEEQMKQRLEQMRKMIGEQSRGTRE